MKSKVIETDGKVFLDNIPPMKFGENMDNTFVRSAQLALNVMGENYSYDLLMGISGAAFRLHFLPGWCPSSADATVGFDVSRVLFKSLGYHCEFVKIDDNSFKDIRSLYKKIKGQINLGRPIVAINMKGQMEWGIVTGYLKNKPGILCRTYFDTSESYTEAKRAPWLNFFIGEKNKTLKTDELFFNSLKTAVKLAKTKSFEEYLSGFAAFEKWNEELNSLLSPLNRKKLAEKMEFNFVIFNILLDARRSAVNYLRTIQADERIQNGDKIIDNYQKVAFLLKESSDNLFQISGSDPGKQIEEIIKNQIGVLTQILEIERKAIDLIEHNLSN